MKRLKAYKFRLYPTQTQIDQLEVEFGNARFVWNHALEMRSKAYKRHILSKKSTKRLRGLRKTAYISAVEEKKIRKLLPYA